MKTTLSNFGIRRGLRIISVAALLGAWAMSAHASWTVINLHPPAMYESRAYGIQGFQQVGYGTFGGIDRPSLWTGSAGSWVDLGVPAGATSGVVYGVHSGIQVGEIFDGAYRASMWSSAPGSWVSLHPAGPSHSTARATDGVQQVGSTFTGGLWNAALWTGSAGSWVNLNPAGAIESAAYGVSGGQQVGLAYFSAVQHAGYWTGSAASWVNLHPGPWAIRSYAYAVHGGQQVGAVQLSSGEWHAGLWTGSAGSWVDLNPAGASNSFPKGVFAGQQVGYAVIAGAHRASLWSGTAASWVDLHQYVPSYFTFTEAHGIWSDGVNTYIVGWGRNAASGRDEALMWVPEPGAGLALAAGLGALALLRRRGN